MARLGRFIHRNRRAEEGAAFISALLAVGVLALLAAATLSLSSTATRSASHWNDRADALHAAESGLNEALWRLDRGESPAWGAYPSGPAWLDRTGAQSPLPDGAEYRVWAEDLGGGVARVTARGVRGNSTRVVSVRLRRAGGAGPDDGRYVAFASDAANLVTGDGNGLRDAFLRDTATPVTERVPAGAALVQGDRASRNPAVSADGRYVAFESDATNLVSGDTNGRTDVFRRDLQTGAVIRVSLGSGGAQADKDSKNPSISADGRYVAFVSKAALAAPCSNGRRHVFVRDTQTGTTTCASSVGNTAGNDDSDNPVLSAGGRYVAFESDATNLVAGDTNGRTDVFRRDLQTGAVIRVSLDAAGAQANKDSKNPSISSNGRHVAFVSKAALAAPCSNGKQHVFVRDTEGAGATACASQDASGAQGNKDSKNPNLSGDGRYVAFESDATNLAAGDTNGKTDVFRRDLQTGATVRVSLDAAGAQANKDSTSPAISADGRYVAFVSKAALAAPCSNGKQHVFVRDTEGAGATACASQDASGTQGNKDSKNPALSADGHYAAFESEATNLVAGDTNGRTDIFLRDRQTQSTERVSAASGAGTNPDGAGDNPVPSGDGRYVAFESDAANLVAGDTNGKTDVFRYDRVTGETILVSVATGGAQGNEDSTDPSISADGRFVAFVSEGGLAAPCTNGKRHVFVRDTQTGTTTCASSVGNTAGNDDSDNPVLSADGRFVAFESDAANLVSGDTNGRTDVFRWELQTGAIIRVSLKGNQEANRNSTNPSISADGRFVAFESGGGLDTRPSPLCTVPGRTYIWVRDTQAGTTTCVSLKHDGTAATTDSANPSISADGRYVAFESGGGLDTRPSPLCTVTGRTYIWVRDTQGSGATACASLDANGAEADKDSTNPSISAGGRYVAFLSKAALAAPCSNGKRHVFVRDTQGAGATTCASVDTPGTTQADADSRRPAINADTLTGASVVGGSWGES